MCLPLTVAGATRQNKQRGAQEQAATTQHFATLNQRHQQRIKELEEEASAVRASNAALQVAAEEAAVVLAEKTHALEKTEKHVKLVIQQVTGARAHAANSFRLMRRSSQLTVAQLAARVCMCMLSVHALEACA